ncbi:hypothetical protein, partial [Corynebacterium sp. KPL2838]|uniref:hypothetical protein n=1 Tax=Corynebacterium sp. KPL2838 TaxID=3158316 RepID=UPI0032EBE2C5
MATVPIAPEPPAMKSDPSTGAELQVWLPNEKDAPPAKIELAPESWTGLILGDEGFKGLIPILH